jgi:3-oxoacyl-[acyl-carrier protein] reductase
MPKTILITGASQGIGRAVAGQLARQDAQIVITYAGNAAKAAQAVQELERQGARAVALPFNLHEAAGAGPLFDQAEAHFGKVDVLISNAFGQSLFKPLAYVEEKEYDQSFASVKGTFFLLQQAARRVNDNGSIVVLSSGATSMPGQAGCTPAAKRPLSSLLSAWQRSWGPERSMST